MAIAKNVINGILSTIFAKGNYIALFSVMPTPSNESAYTEISGTGYSRYEIKDNEFSIYNGEATSNKNMLLYLCDSTGGHGTAKGFGVFGEGKLLYYGEFKEEMPITYNTVPVIKKYSESKEEGVKVTVTSTETVG